MIHIKFEEPNTKNWKKWRKDCEKATKKLLEDVEKGIPPKIGAFYKRECIKKEVYFNENGPFHGKCAYCECYTSDGDMDHYRPKLAVTDENDNPVLILDKNGKEIPHPGYYWLAYDWKNLLPTCKGCNQPSMDKRGKRNRFPLVNNTYAITPEKVNDEQRLLINPLEDDPSEHILVSLETGIFSSKTQMGKKTIDILGLNDRDRLPAQRLNKIDTINALLDQLIKSKDPALRLKSLEEIKKIWDGNSDFSFLGIEYLNSELNWVKEFTKILEEG